MDDLSIIKRTNGPNLEIGAHKFQKIRPDIQCVFANWSRSVIDQWVKFDHIVVLTLLQLSNDMDCDLVVQNSGKNKKHRLYIL